MIPSGVTVTLDLNGCSIDRGLKDEDPISDGNVITVNGTLTLTDSVGGGEITGGNNEGDGGGVVNYGTITMDGGTISGNTANSEGGGVLNEGTFTIDDGTISGNTATHGGGVLNNGIFTIDGGTISENTAGPANQGGGVRNYGTFTMSGGTIYGNSATNGGGVFFAGGTFEIQNAPVIQGNVTGGMYEDGIYTGGTASNVYLDSGKTLTVTGPLSNTSPIGISMEPPPRIHFRARLIWYGEKLHQRNRRQCRP